MPLRLKITLGLLTLLLLLVGAGGYGLWTVRRIDLGSRDSLKANFYSVELGQAMLRALDVLAARPPVDSAAVTAAAAFRQALTREAGNITEPGEREVVDSLTQVLALVDRGQDPRLVREDEPHTGTGYDPLLVRLRDLTHRMIALNVAGLTTRNEAANASARHATNLLILILSTATLLGLMLVWSVPEAAVAPLLQLQAGIRHATNRDFSQTIPVETRDEFGAVARDFNELLVQLREFRSSTLAEVLTERNRLSSVINSLDEGLLLIDQNRRVLLVNPVAAGLLGTRADELIGKSTEEAGPANDLLREITAPLGRTGAAGAPAEPPLLTIAPPDGGPAAYYRVTTHEIVAFNPAREQLEFVGSIVALRNVSDFKQLDLVKSNFLATVSHELKTPLASLSLSFKLLDDERVAPDERRRLVAGLRQETQRLQKLVSELLDVSRLESGNIALDFHATTVADLVQFAAQPVQPQLLDKQLTLHTTLPPDLPLVRADVEKATWVLLNLLANAIRYSPPGSTIEVRAARAAGPAVQVSVQDHGPGIAAAHHERIFQRFARLADHHQYPGGSGLGLSIAREFIQAQGGRLWVESELGAGSTFHFTLPVA